MNVPSKDVNYFDVESVYRKLAPELINYAKQRLILNDDAIDAVHEAFENVIKWKTNHPGKPINPKVVYGQVTRVCRKLNRRQAGIASLDDPALSGYFRTKQLLDSPKEED